MNYRIHLTTGQMDILKDALYCAVCDMERTAEQASEDELDEIRQRIAETDALREYLCEQEPDFPEIVEPEDVEDGTVVTLPSSEMIFTPNILRWLRAGRDGGQPRWADWSLHSMFPRLPKRVREQVFAGHYIIDGESAVLTVGATGIPVPSQPQPILVI